MPAGVEHARCLSHGFFCGIAGDIAKGAIHPQDPGRGIGDDHALLRIESGGSNAKARFVQFAFGEIAYGSAEEPTFGNLPFGQREFHRKLAAILAQSRQFDGLAD